MNIVMITENDPAGAAIALTRALNAHTPHGCRLITTEVRYNFMFEKDLHIPALDPSGLEEVEQVLKDADILHFHMLADENLPLGPIDLKDYLKGKVLVHHHHGHPVFRSNPGMFREKYRRLRRKTLVSTPDLLHLLPGAFWQPNIVPIDHPLYRPCRGEPPGTLTIGQSPTRKDLKNTDDLIGIFNELQEDASLPKIRLDIIEHCPHGQCLERKKRCHIIFDHMQGYFGVSSLEALSQGKPVIAGLDQWNMDQIKAVSGSRDLPWLIARDREELKKTLRRLILDRELRESSGMRSRSFMEKHWNETKMTRRLEGFYREL